MDSTLTASGAFIVHNSISMGYVTAAASAASGASAVLDLPSQPVALLKEASLTSIAGITSPLNIGLGSLYMFTNRTGGTVTLLNDVGSPTTNRLLTGTGGDLDIANNASFLAFFQDDTNKWHVIGAGGGGAGGGLPVRDTFATASAAFTPTTDARQVWVYTGTGGTLGTIPPGNLSDQTEFEITSASGALVVEHNDAASGYFLNGDKTLGKYGKLVIRWDSTFSRYIEVAYNGL